MDIWIRQICSDSQCKQFIVFACSLSYLHTTKHDLLYTL